MSKSASGTATPLAHDAPRAEDVAVALDIPSRRNSTDERFTFDGYQLEAIDGKDQVHHSHEVVRDRKTGKHYKKVAPPVWSIAHGATASREAGASSTIQKAHNQHGHGQKYSVGHVFGDAAHREPGTVGSASGTSSRPRTIGTKTPPVGGALHGSNVSAGMSAADLLALMEQMRAIVRQEVATANRGHAEHVERVINDNITTGETEKVHLDGSDSSGSTTSDKEMKERDTKTNVLDPKEAERGVADVDAPTDADAYEFPNPWAKFRYQCREPFAEFLGCFVLMIFGDGINIQALFATDYDPSTPRGSYLSVSFGWGIATMMGVYVSGGIINPSITIALAMFRGLPWKKVPIYIFAQILGATLGALCIYGLYNNPIKSFDPDKTQATAAYFTTFPASFIEPPGARIIGTYNEILATMILALVVFAINDSSNTPPPDGLAPLVLMWLVTGIGATLGWQTAYAVNQARDLGPRIALSIVGYRGLWTYNAWYWARVPFLGPLVGAPLGALIYDLFIYSGGDSPINQPWEWRDLKGRWRPTWRATSKQIPAGMPLEEGQKQGTRSRV